MVRIETTGDTVLSALRTFGGSYLVEAIDTDTLLQELCHRLASEDPPRVLRILPFVEPDLVEGAHKFVVEDDAAH